MNQWSFDRVYKEGESFKIIYICVTRKDRVRPKKILLETINTFNLTKNIIFIWFNRGKRSRP